MIHWRDMLASPTKEEMARVKKGREMTDQSENITTWQLPSDDCVMSLMVAVRIARRALAVCDVSLHGYITETEADSIRQMMSNAADTFGTLAVICAAGREAIDRGMAH
jgi:hypothetical protein